MAILLDPISCFEDALMAINSAAVNSFNQVSQLQVNSNPGSAKRSENAEPLSGGKQPNATERREQLNTTIMQAHYEVSLKTKDNPNTLLFKNAIEAINKELEPTLGKNAAQKAFESGIDFSPEAVAERIVGFATAFFPLYQGNHKNEPLEKQLNDFIDLVGGGVDKGFGEAKDILDGLGVFEGEVEENANTTYDLIFEGFEKFKSSVLEANQPEAPTEPV